jgi:VWFA-related protein
MGEKRSRFWYAPALVLAVFSGGADAASQSAPKPQTPVFGADVALVAVPVFVVDKNGKSVPGLTIDDFEIEDGGKKVPIVAFQAIDVDAPMTAVTQAQVSQLPVAVQAVARRQFLLLIDLQFSPRSGVYFGRKAAMAFVREALAPGDLVAVATTGPSGLRVLTNFTSDHEHTARAIAGLTSPGSTGADPLGLGGGPGAASGSGTRMDQEFASQDAAMKEFAESENRHDAKAFVGDLLKLTELLAPLRGRKQIVLLSGGFPEGLWFASPNKGSSTAGDADALLAMMESAFRRAGESDVVIHTVSLKGIEGPIDVAGRTGRDPVYNTGGPAPNLKMVVDTKAMSDGRGTLITMAAKTGGRFILPTNDFGKALGEVDQISRHSYVIAFEAAEFGTKGDKRRSLKVRVRGEGRSVSHRPSYGAPAPLKTPDAGTMNRLAAEAISKGLTEGPLQLHLTTLPHRGGEGKLAVHASLFVEGPELAAAAQGAQLAVQVFGYVLEEGAVLDSLAFTTSVDLGKYGEAARNSGIRVLTAFPVSAGAKDLRFFVRVGDSDLSGSIQRNIEVPTFADSSLVLSPPLFGLPLEGKVVIPFQPKDRPRIDIPFRVGDQSFVPESPARLTTGSIREICVLVWPAGQGATTVFEVTAEIVSTDKTSRALTFDSSPEVVKDSDGFDRYIVPVVGPEAPKGSYTLRVTFRDPSTGRRTATETTVWLEN